MLSDADIREQLSLVPPLKATGRVTGIKGPIIHAVLPRVVVGELCLIHRTTLPPLKAQVIGFSEHEVRLSPFDFPRDISPGAKVHATGGLPSIEISDDCLGTIVDAYGDVLSGANATYSTLRAKLPIDNDPPPPLTRVRITQQLFTGIRAIDAFCPIGHGQRIGLFAGPGLGKSTLLGTIARNAQVDIVVIALVGERGREVQEFITDSLGERQLKKSIVVVATSDESPLKRSAAPLAATAYAEYFRKQGKNVLLLVDSLTRTARALRDVSLAAGELPVRQGYTPSVFSALPRLLERAGNDERGSITAVYTLLTNDSEESDPLAEEVKSLLDGHLVLNSSTANEGIRPAIDVVSSLSRLTSQLCSSDILDYVCTIRQSLALIKKERDFLLLGGVPSPALAIALGNYPAMKAFLTQKMGENDTSPLLPKIKALAERLKKF